MVARASSGLRITPSSVSSRTRHPGARPVSANTCSTSSARFAFSSSLGARFTLTESPARPGNVACQAFVCLHASRSTTRPIFTIRPSSSASGMKLAGGITPWPADPANERLETDQPSVAQVHDGLVVHHDLAALDRPLERRAKLCPRAHALLHLRLEADVAALALLLRRVHGNVGVAQELGGRDARRPECEADADVHDERLALDVVSLERVDEALRDPLGVLLTGRGPAPRTRRRPAAPARRAA